MKWIIVCTFKSGAKWAWSRRQHEFALVPLQNGRVNLALAWDSKAEAEDYLIAQLEVAPGLAKLGPFEFIEMEERQP